MTNKEILQKIQSKLEENLKVHTEFIEGSGDAEFGKPDTITFGLPGQKKVIVEISAKIGSSWYFSGCSGIRLITLGLKGHETDIYYTKQFKMLDFSSDPELIYSWITDKFANKMETDPELLEISGTWRKYLTAILPKILRSYHELGKKIGKLPQKRYYQLSLKQPKIQYNYNDIDNEFECLVMDSKLSWMPEENEKGSIILQFRKDVETKKINVLGTFRILTDSDTPTLIRLDEEVELTPDTFIGWVKKKLVDVLSSYLTYEELEKREIENLLNSYNCNE